MSIIQILGWIAAGPLIYAIVDCVNGLHEILVDCQVDGVHIRVILREGHGVGDDFHAVVFVDKASTGEFGIESVAECF